MIKLSTIQPKLDPHSIPTFQEMCLTSSSNPAELSTHLPQTKDLKYSLAEQQNENHVEIAFCRPNES